MTSLIPGPWVFEAACSPATADLFMPDRYTGKRSHRDTPEIREAKATCRGCVVRLECARHSLLTGEKEGVWGGLTPAERAALLREVAS